MSAKKAGSGFPALSGGDRAGADPARRWEGKVDTEKALRADRWIAETAGILSRSQLKARNAHIYINGKEIKSSKLLHGGELLVVEWTEEPESSLVPEAIPLTILYEDSNLFVVDKAQGMVTHPGHGNRCGTLANAILFLETAPSVEHKVARAGIVHRLDKDTSGLIVVARNAPSQAFLAAQFKERLVHKEYLALVRGWPDAGGRQGTAAARLLGQGRIENRLARDPRDRKRFAALPENSAGGKLALTKYRVLIRWAAGVTNGYAGGTSGYAGATSGYGGGRKGSAAALGQALQGAYALVALYPKTGRTHQLRVHMAGLGCPIVGDPLYGKKDALFPDATLMLHARRLRIALPDSAGPVLFKAELPERFRTLVRALDARFARL